MMSSRDCGRWPGPGRCEPEAKRWRLLLWLMSLMLFGWLAGAPASALAQEESEEGVVYKKKTVISFDDDTIDGDLMRPDGAYVESRKRVRHSNLIRIREDFKTQILNSANKL